jgi:hypothetical protein
MEKVSYLWRIGCLISVDATCTCLVGVSGHTYVIGNLTYQCNRFTTV